MARLPKNYVKPPAFDNPLRPTADPKPDLAIVEDAPKKKKAKKVARPAAKTVDAPVQTDELKHRFTTRLTDAQWRGLQTELFNRRMAGQKCTTADLVREIVSCWLATTGE